VDDHSISSVYNLALIGELHQIIKEIGILSLFAMVMKDNWAFPLKFM
jgi:hypothetical protein